MVQVCAEESSGKDGEQVEEAPGYMQLRGSLPASLGAAQ